MGKVSSVMAIAVLTSFTITILPIIIQMLMTQAHKISGITAIHPEVITGGTTMGAISTLDLVRTSLDLMG
jgi:hypothetical protein